MSVYIGAPSPPACDDGDSIHTEIINTPLGRRARAIRDHMSALPDDHSDIQRFRTEPPHGGQAVVFVRPICSDDFDHFQRPAVVTDDGKLEYPNMCIVHVDAKGQRRRTFLKEQPDAWPTDMEAVGYLSRRPYAGFLLLTLEPILQKRRDVLHAMALLDECKESERIMEELFPDRAREDAFSSSLRELKERNTELRREIADLRRQLASKEKGAA